MPAVPQPRKSVLSYLAVGAASLFSAWASAAELRCDLAVVGGGSGGFGAALAAARLGLEVVLVEKADCLGGTSTRAGVNCWEPGAGGTGIPFDLYERLKKIPNAVGVYSFGRHLAWFQKDREPYRYPGGETVIDPARRYIDTLQRCGSRGMGADEAYCREHWHGVVFEPESMAKTMLAMLQETGRCRVLFGSPFVRAESADGLVRSIALENGTVVRADYFIDATGDAWLCQAVGCETMMGQESRDRFNEPAAPDQATKRINGVSLLYRAAVATTEQIEPLADGIPAKCWWRASFPVAQVNHYPNGDLNINPLPLMTGDEFLRLGYDAALAECGRRVRAHWHFLQSEYAEFRKFRLAQISPALGVRESQRVVGEYVLTQNDLIAGISGQKHPDMVCLADHSMDTHGGHAKGGEMRQPYGVPYRCLIPKGQRNLLVACRAASFSSLAASSCRLSRTMMQLGQAAGTAAAIAKQDHTELPAVNPDRLRAALRQQHVQLEVPMPDALRAYLAGTL